jgi:hypothetical protein
LLQQYRYNYKTMDFASDNQLAMSRLYDMVSLGDASGFVQRVCKRCRRV